LLCRNGGNPLASFGEVSTELRMKTEFFVFNVALFDPPRSYLWKLRLPHAVKTPMSTNKDKVYGHPNAEDQISGNP
jgi:hypothetical protein